MSFRPTQLTLSPQQQAEHDCRLAEADIHVLDLARLLQSAAFPDRPRLGDFDTIAPLYLRQATALRGDYRLRSDLSEILERMS